MRTKLDIYAFITITGLLVPRVSLAQCGHCFSTDSILDILIIDGSFLCSSSYGDIVVLSDGGKKPPKAEFIGLGPVK